MQMRGLFRPGEQGHIQSRRGLLDFSAMLDASPVIRAIIAILFVFWIVVFVLALFDAFPI